MLSAFIKNPDKKWPFKEHFVVFRKFATEYIVLISYIMSTIFCPQFRDRGIFFSPAKYVHLFLSDNVN